VETNTSSRIPFEVNGIQYNFCKNPKCSNFGVPVPEKQAKGNNSYILTGVNKGGDFNIPHVKCNCCGGIFPLKSNHAIAEEIDRLYSYLQTEEKVHSCTNNECANHSVPVGTKKAYIAFGTTAGGSKRYRCNLCKKTFITTSKATKGQHDTFKNIEIFKLLVNKVPLNRIIEITEVSWHALYNKIDFIHKQCIDFASSREKQLKDMPIKRVYLAVDRQEYAVNWTERKDKRNVILTAMASADNSTNYVFAINPNFDGSVDKRNIEVDSINVGDHTKTAPFRKYARLWLEQDYLESSKRKRYSKSKVTNNLKEEIQAKYDEVQVREDVENFDEKNSTDKLPNYGAQVHAEYTMIAHFHLLKKMLGNVEMWRVFLDQDSGFRGAFLSVFQKDVAEHTAEAFYVRIEKNLTVDEKRRFKAQAKKKFEEIKKLNPNLSDNDIKIELLKREIASVKEIGSYKDKWINHPLPSMAEANKAMCWLTKHDTFDETHIAWLYNKASLHGIDSFFEKCRRRVAMLERPIHSASNIGRTWNGYGAYNPTMVVKMLEIFRVVHNYIDVSKVDKETPAMRLGLAQAPLSYKTVLYNE
jgi:transposase-like protein